MPQDNLDSVVASGIPLHKAIAMGMAGEGGPGQGDGSYDRSSPPKGEAKPNVKDDMGMPETMPGMKMKRPDQY